MIVTRFAPSPTGYVHVGNLRTALYSYLYAKRHQGRFFVRVEDTDQSRYVEGAVESLLKTLHTCGITPDAGVRLSATGEVEEAGEHGPYTQSKRLPIYQRFAAELVEKGYAYPCFCSRERLEEARTQAELTKQSTKYDRHCLHLSKEEVTERLARGESHVIRLKVPNGETVFEDLIRGTIRFSHDEVDDQVLLKSDGFPTYHLAVVVDDHLMEVTHVIRGEEWLSSTPKHLILYQMFGWQPPAFAHLPLILNPDRTKLSKRQGDVAVEDYLKNGYLPEAIVNFIALIGWNPSGDRELYTLSELIATFDISAVNKGGGVFNREKLDWMNGEYIKQAPTEDVLTVVRPMLERKEVMVDEQLLRRVVEVEKSRLTRLDELVTRLSMYTQEISIDPTLLVWKKSTPEETLTVLQSWQKALSTWDETAFVSVASLEVVARAHVEQEGGNNGTWLWPLRVALSGQAASPSPFEMLFALGPIVSRARITAAITALTS